MAGLLVGRGEGDADGCGEDNPLPPPPLLGDGEAPLVPPPLLLAGEGEATEAADTVSEPRTLSAWCKGKWLGGAGSA